MRHWLCWGSLLEFPCHDSSQVVFDVDTNNKTDRLGLGYFHVNTEKKLEDWIVIGQGEKTGRLDCHLGIPGDNVS